MNNEVVTNLEATGRTDSTMLASNAGGLRPVLEIEDLRVQFETGHGIVRAVDGLSYSVYPGEMVAIVG